MRERIAPGCDEPVSSIRLLLGRCLPGDSAYHDDAGQLMHGHRLDGWLGDQMAALGRGRHGERKARETGEGQGEEGAAADHDWLRELGDLACSMQSM